MGYDIGPRIGITGEREFNNQIQKINGRLKLLGSEMNLLTKKYDGNSDSLDFLQDKNEILKKQLQEQDTKVSVLSKAYKEQSEKLGNLKKELENATKAYGENSAEALKAENALRKQEDVMAKLGTSINETKGYCEALKNQIADNSKKMDELSAAEKNASSKLGELTQDITRQQKELAELQRAYQEAAISKGKDDRETQQLAAQITALSKDLQTNKQRLSAVQTESKQLAGALDEVEDSAKDAGDGFTIMKGAMADITADGIQSLAESLKELVTQSDGASASFQAATGASADEMKRYNEEMKELYNNDYGDSLQDIADSMARVKQQMSDLDDEDLKNVTAGVKTLEDTFDMDFNETLRGTKQLMYQFGLSAEDSMDLIAMGAQNGLNYTDELGDNISEYAGKFAQAGYGADDYFQLLKNGSQNGAYNLDKINDAINEVTTRLADGTIEDSLDMFSSETGKVFKAWKDGRATQKDVIDAIVKDIGKTTNQQKKLTKAATAFGTMGEDANAKFVESLTSVGDEFSDVSGKMKEIQDIKYGTVESQLRGLGRTLQTDLLEPMIQDAMPVLKGGVEWMIDNLPLVEGALVTLGTAATTAFAVNKISKFKDSITNIAGGLTKLATADIPGVSSALGGLGSLLAAHPLLALAGVATAAGTAMFIFSQKTDAATEAIKKSSEETQKQIDAWKEMQAAQEEAVEGIYGNFEYYAQLKTELESITSANGEVKKGYEDRARVILGELNDALGTELQMNGNIIDSYKEQMKNIDDLITKKQAQALVDSGMDEYTEAVKKNAQATRDMLKAEEEYAAKKAELQPEIDALSEKMISSADKLAPRRRAQLQAELDVYKENYEKKKELADGYTQTIAEQKYLMEEMEKGTAESQKNIVDYVANTYKENGKSLRLSTQEQIDMLKRYVAEHKNSEDAAVKKQVEASEMQLKTLEKQLKDELGVVTDAIPEHATLWETMCTAGLNAYKKNEDQFLSAAFGQTEKAKKGIDDGTPQTKAAWQALADKGYAVLDGNTWKYTDAGENYALGLKNGVNNRAGEVFGAVSNMGLMMISALHDSLKENSPSKAAFEAGDFFTIGTINGVENEKKKLFSTITDMGKGMVERLQDNSAIMQRAQSEMFGVDGTFLSNTKAILESEQVNQINVYLDSRMIEQMVVKRVNRNQTFKSIVTGG